MNDEAYLRLTFAEARKGLGATWPNPLVGAVIVKDGRIIGRGYHHRSGQDHAEVDALKNCSESPEGATIFVNLEPCCHTNKQTPPCAQRLIKEKLKRVVICNLDPNPEVLGNGIALLRANGIEVQHGILAGEGEELNEVFFHAQRTRRPFVHLKLATTLDGKLALPSGESRWITGEKSRHLVHELRAQSQAVGIGAETLRRGNPKLNVRLEGFTGPQPFRVVFTRSGVLPINAQLFSDELREKTLVYSLQATSLPQAIRVASIDEALSDLFQKKIITLFLEGGPTLAGAFLSAGQIQRITQFINPSYLGTGLGAITELEVDALDQRPRLTSVQSTQVGEDICITGRLA